MANHANDIKKLEYLLNMLGTSQRRTSESSFESLLRPEMGAHIRHMLRNPPIATDEYLCATTAAQTENEREIRRIYEDLLDRSGDGDCFDEPISVDLHLTYIEKHLFHSLPAPFVGLDASHLWMVYWLANSHVVLSGQPLAHGMKQRVSTTVRLFIVEDGKGGIAGGPGGQIGHVASTYAGVLALVLAEDYETLKMLSENLPEWFLSLKREDGSFSMHTNGESDTRSTYCVLAVGAMLGIHTKELLRRTRQWVLSCQTYEGGFGGVPGTEAHGGYTFCAVASLVLMDSEGAEGTVPEGTEETEKAQDTEGLRPSSEGPSNQGPPDEGPSDQRSSGLNIRGLLRWLTYRQNQVEGGFSGRSNKLIDACYSFWVGAALVLVELMVKSHVFSRDSLRAYIHNCCQLQETGGLRDKPYKRPDFYHTNYALCGLSMAEYYYSGSGAFDYTAEEVNEGSAYTVPVNPVLGIPLDSAQKCLKVFQKGVTEN